MTRYMLDTNHLSPLVTQGHHLRIRVLELQTQGNTFDIAVPALTEFLFGILLTPRVATNLEEWEELQSNSVFLASESGKLNKLSICKQPCAKETGNWPPLMH